MRPSTYKVLLVIADISGFTQFMKSHANAANHAMQVIVELLKALIATAAPPLKLAEVEGDAAFFYAMRKEEGDMTRELVAIKGQVMSFFRSFYQTLHRLCALYPCARNARDLRLKVVLHAGEVALENIHGFDKLFGMDVILAHRLLKNSVPAQEYVLMTESTYNWLGGFYELEPERQTEYYEGIGEVETMVMYPPARLVAPSSTRIEDFGGRVERLPLISSYDRVHAQQLAGQQNTILFERPNGRPKPPSSKTVLVALLETKWHHDYAIHIPAQSRQQEFKCGRSP